MSRSGKLSPVVVALGAVLVLVGCGTPAPGPSASTTDTAGSPAPSAEPGPAAAIEIGATELTVRDDEGAEIAVAPYAGPVSELVATLTDAFGNDPEVQQPGTEDCAAVTSYLWGPDEQNLVVREAVVAPASPYTAVTVSAKAATVEGLDIVASAGFQVGDDVSELLATFPPDQVNEAIQFVFEVSDSVEGASGPLPFGAYAFADYDTQIVSSMAAPGSFGSGYC